jgi:hypothetical protein
MYPRYIAEAKHRPKFYKTNLRQFDPFIFLPIDPPRPPSNNETFGRRRHEFFTPASKGNGLFNNPFRKASHIPVRFSVEARLPNPPILVPNDPIPLRVMLNKTDPFPDVIFMRMLQIALLSDTQIRAHELSKVEQETIVILSVSDLQIPIGNENSVPGQELEVNPTMWLGRSLPENIPPSFTTCNISRSYSLKVDIGLSCGRLGHVDVCPSTWSSGWSPLLMVACRSFLSRSLPRYTPASNPRKSSSKPPIESRGNLHDHLSIPVSLLQRIRSHQLPKDLWTRRD